MSVDAAGSAYVMGFTSSVDFPVTAGAFDTTANGAFDVFVTKVIVVRIAADTDESTPPAPPPPTVVLTLTATGRNGERVTSSPSGINVATGASGSASFAPGTSVTLSVSNGRDAIWFGACSSNGNKRRTCTFTINAATAVTATVQ